MIYGVRKTTKKMVGLDIFLKKKKMPPINNKCEKCGAYVKGKRKYCIPCSDEIRSENNGKGYQTQ
jgi:uncharacterized OB-fold protein